MKLRNLIILSKPFFQRNIPASLKDDSLQNTFIYEIAAKEAKFWIVRRANALLGKF